MKLRDYLFKDIPPCSNHDCVVRKPTGMGTNGSCGCLFNLNRAQFQILNSRIKSAGNYELVEQGSDLLNELDSAIAVKSQEVTDEFGDKKMAILVEDIEAILIRISKLQKG